MVSDRMATIIIWVVTTVWAVNFLAGLTHFNGYQSDQAINGIFMGIVGGLFAIKARHGNRSGGEG